MTERTVDPARVARGHAKGEVNRKCVILLDNETFDEVRERAIASKTSFAAEARVLIEIGLETMKEERRAAE